MFDACECDGDSTASKIAMAAISAIAMIACTWIKAKMESKREASRNAE